MIRVRDLADRIDRLEARMRVLSEEVDAHEQRLPKPRAPRAVKPKPPAKPVRRGK